MTQLSWEIFLKTRAVSLVFFGVFALISTSHGTPFPAELRDKQFLEDLDWNDSASLDRITKNWGSASREGFVGRVELKAQDVELDGIEVAGSLRKKNSSGDHEIYFYKVEIDGGFEEKERIDVLAFCKKINAENSSRYGSPKEEINYTTFNSDNSAVIEAEAYWDVGSTRVTNSCTIIDGDNFYFGQMSFRYGDIDNETALVQPKWLKCTQNEQWFGPLSEDPAPTINPSIDIIIRTDRETITSPSLNFGDNAQFSSNQIIVTEDSPEKKMTKKFSLSRNTGNYEFVIEIDNEHGVNGVKYWGNCEVGSSEPKF